jgi:hypothetical protein
MRASITILCLVTVLLPGCQISLLDAFGYKGFTPPPQLELASEFVGLNERQDRVTLKEFMGIDPVRLEWCAAFVNSV